MTRSIVRPEDSLVLVVDMQPSFLNAIHESERIMARSEFLLKVANVLGVPCLATEQYPSRMGGTDERLLPLLGGDTPAPLGKMDFSCCGCTALLSLLDASERHQIVLVGIETHICVSQTAHDLLDRGFEVIVCGDAVGSRTESRHVIGLQRIRDAGAIVAHSESVAYEWMRTAEHPKFKEALAVVKAAES